MARRTQIVDALVDHLAANTDALPSNVIKRFAYMHEVNDFPAITLVPRREQRTHRGVGRIHAITEVMVRGYIHDGDDAIGAADTLADQIETAVDTFSDTYPQFAVEEARCVAVSTDDGLYRPYGLTDVTIQILYDVEITT